MALRYSVKKGFSGKFLADLVNTIALVAGLGLLFENNAPASYLTWWTVGFVAGLMTLSVAVGLRYRTAHPDPGEAPPTGVDALFWATILIGLCTIIGGLLSLGARYTYADSGEDWQWALPLAVIFAVAAIVFYCLYFYFIVARANARRGLLFMILYFAAGGVMAIFLIVLGALIPPVTVPVTFPAKIAGGIFTVLGLIFWQDAELVNAFSSDQLMQQLKSIAQCVGAMVLLIAVILGGSAGPQVVWFWVGVGIAVLGTLTGAIVGIVSNVRKHANAGPQGVGGGGGAAAVPAYVPPVVPPVPNRIDNALDEL